MTWVPPPTLRSNLMLAIAGGLLSQEDFIGRPAFVTLKARHGQSANLTFGASDGLSMLDDVVQGRVQLGVVNPSALLTLAYRGTAPFEAPTPVRGVTVMPSPDQLGLAVASRTGIGSLSDIAAKHYPLRISVRGQREHALHVFLRHIMAVGGFSSEDLEAWGGEVRYDRELPNGPNRLGAFERGEIDAIWDEAVQRFAAPALAAGARFISLSQDEVQQLESVGFRAATIRRDQYPGLDEDVVTLDFSGWALFTRADVEDAVITAICASLAHVPEGPVWEGTGPLPLAKMCGDTEEAPLGVPLHPAAERFWREGGYLA